MRFRFVKIGLILIIIAILIQIGSVCLKGSNSNRSIYVKSSYFGDSNGSAEKPYRSILEAIDVANDGDIIYIFGGVYRESREIVINKQLKIVGSVDEVETIIDSPYTISDKYIFSIRANGVSVEYVTIRDNYDKLKQISPTGALMGIFSSNNKILNNKFTNVSCYAVYVSQYSQDNIISSNAINNAGAGVYITSSETNDVLNNKISNCSSYGIYIEYSTGNNRFYGNELSNCNSAIYALNSANLNITSNKIYNSSSSSISLFACTNSSIDENTVKNGSSHAIHLKSSGCIISNNVIERNGRGINLEGNENKIYNNTIKDQSGTGIYASSGTSQNVIFENKFINNSKSAQDYGSNKWYYESKGNYWSDYNYIDRDLDGIGDREYSKYGVIDPYPLGFFLKPPNKPSNPSPKDLETNVGLGVTLKIKVSDPDSDELTVYFYRGDTDTLIASETPNPVKRARNNSVVECKFTLPFDTVFAWYVVVNDSLLENRSDTFMFSTRSTPPGNKVPIAKSGGPYSTRIGKAVEFNSSGSYDPDGNIVFYRWNFGDESTEILEKNPKHVYNENKTYYVTLTVIDNNGSSASSSTYVIVRKEENTKPVAIAKIVDEAVVGEEISFDASDSYDPDGDSLTYKWLFGNGDTRTGKIVNYAYPSSGTYVVTLNVSDGELSSTFTKTITIKEKQGTPGFEFLMVVICLVIIYILKKTKV